MYQSVVCEYMLVASLCVDLCTSSKRVAGITLSIRTCSYTYMNVRVCVGYIPVQCDDPWEWWNTLRTLCDNNSKLHLGQYTEFM